MQIFCFMAEGVGYGKTILFGEHFVVYGLPAIAAGFDRRTVCMVEDSGEFLFLDERPETPGYKHRKSGEIGRQIDFLKRHFRLESREPVKITLSGDLVCASGVGASAALAASISHALNNHFDLGLGVEDVNRAAYLAEEAGSGNPSGIDNTVSVYGGFIVFEKNLEGGENRIETISVDEPFHIVMANSGVTQTTKEVVEDVRRQYDADPVGVGAVFAEYAAIQEAGLKAILDGDYAVLGRLMEENQGLLARLDLSCPEIEQIVSASKKAGALGAKLTGTGRGGSVIILADDEDAADKVVSAVEVAGYCAFKTRVGV